MSSNYDMLTVEETKVLPPIYWTHSPLEWVYSFLWIASSVMAMFAANFAIADLSPDKIMSWVLFGISAATALFNFGLWLYHEANKAKRNELREWKRHKLGLPESKNNHPAHPRKKRS